MTYFEIIWSDSFSPEKKTTRHATKFLSIQYTFLSTQSRCIFHPILEHVSDSIAPSHAERISSIIPIHPYPPGSGSNSLHRIANCIPLHPPLPQPVELQFPSRITKILIGTSYSIHLHPFLLKKILPSFPSSQPSQPSRCFPWCPSWSLWWRTPRRRSRTPRRGAWPRRPTRPCRRPRAKARSRLRWWPRRRPRNRYDPGQWGVGDGDEWNLAWGIFPWDFGCKHSHMDVFSHDF